MTASAGGVNRPACKGNRLLQPWPCLHEQLLLQPWPCLHERLFVTATASGLTAPPLQSLQPQPLLPLQPRPPGSQSLLCTSDAIATATRSLCYHCSLPVRPFYSLSVRPHCTFDAIATAAYSLCFTATACQCSPAPGQMHPGKLPNRPNRFPSPPRQQPTTLHPNRFHSPHPNHQPP